jgi:aspartate racemase
MMAIGIIGGIGPESTILYYRHLIEQTEAVFGVHTAPRIVVNSINMKFMLSLVKKGDLEELIKYLGSEVEILAKAGATLAAFASNTPHIVFDEVSRISELPLVSIVEATCSEVLAKGYSRVGLVGTSFTMNSGMYQEKLEPHGVNVFVPSESEQIYLHRIYMDELVRGVIKFQTRDRFSQIAKQLQEDYAIQALILGGTELSLLPAPDSLPGISLLDTSLLHVEAILKVIRPH